MARRIPGMFEGPEYDDWTDEQKYETMRSPLVTDDSDIKIIDGKDYGGYISTSINGSTIDEE